MIKLQYMKKCGFVLIAAFCLVTLSPSEPSFGHIGCSVTSHCKDTSKDETDDSIEEVNDHTTAEFEAGRVWWISIFWEDNLLPALMLMSEQLTAVAAKQTEIIGGFFDAKQQLETQQTLQKFQARAHKDYHPSTGMCEFGSSVKSLAASDRLGETNAIMMAQRSIDRGLGNANTASAAGAYYDSRSRIQQFREVYCDLSDNGGGMGFMCDHDQNFSGGAKGGADPHRRNKDIDYMATVDFPWTLDVNFADAPGTPKPDEEDVLALATNLYGTDVFRRPPPTALEDNEDFSAEMIYMNARSILAKRGVAENSYNALIGMKSEGTAGSRDFLEALLAELGVDDATANVKGPTGASLTSPATSLDAMLGKNPSYWAQMEVLTKKIYQNPDFYTNLYDKPANVERKGLAIQAIGLMQKFDLLKSTLREEMTQSVLLELAVSDLQRYIESGEKE